jgi:hypothetical protein
MIDRARKRLSKRAKKGFRGWPLATVALYGPDYSTATKLTVGIVPAADAEATDFQRWFSKEQADIRDDIRVAEEVLAFITGAGAKSVVMTDQIIGCPHGAAPVAIQVTVLAVRRAVVQCPSTLAGQT